VGIKGREEVADTSLIRKGRAGRILVIDDEELVRVVISQILTQAEHQVTVVENGEYGIQLFGEKEFDIVLTDLGMPTMSGLEVCKAIKEMNPNTPVGMITGWGMEIDQSQNGENGIDFIIPKPFDFNQILNVVAETMESKVMKHPF
jgi:CheY-like chemotaxis protein